MMDIASVVVRNVFYPLWMIKDGDGGMLRHLDCFDGIDRTGRSAAQARQLQRLRAILEHAYRNTDYYRDVFDAAGFSPGALRDVAQLERLPILTKDIVRRQFDRLTARNIAPRALTRASTGGSTGAPMTFLRDRDSLYLRKGQELFFDAWMGYRLGMKAALFVAASHHDGIAQKWKARIRNATCERLLRFDPHHITDDYMAAFARRYIAFRPQIIKCFPNSLAIFADFLERRGLRVPPVRAISCTGENLYAHQRALFARTFGGEVFEKYGTRESGVIACECRQHQGLHVFTDGVVLEILDAHGAAVGPGEMGRVIITDLFNRAMPLIRYEIGDMAIAAGPEACACGSSLPLVAKIVGRDRDILYDGDGNPKPGYLFVEVINDLDLPAQFQIVQTARDRLLVKVVAQERDPAGLEVVRARYQEIVGPRVRVDFEFTDAIPRDPSGKYRYVVSHASAACT